MPGGATCTRVVPTLGILLVSVSAQALTDVEAQARAPKLVPDDPGIRLVSATPTEVMISLDDPQGHSIGELRLSTLAPPWEVPRFTTPSFYYNLQSHQPEQRATDRLVQLAQQ